MPFAKAFLLGISVAWALEDVQIEGEAVEGSCALQKRSGRQSDRVAASQGSSDKLSKVTEDPVTECSEHWDYVDPLKCWPQWFPLCGGGQQSPIDIVTSEASPISPAANLKLNHGTLNDTKLKNNGHALQVDYKVGFVTFGNIAYNTLQLHFHFPSEHAIDGTLSTAEMHVVHQKQSAVGLDALLVTSVMYDKGAQSDFFAGMGWTGNLPAREGDTVSLGTVSNLDIELEAAKAGGWYTYAGSLTTPPCSETVRWVVFATKRTVSQEQADKFQVLFPNPPANNRPLQPLNDRIVEKDGGGKGNTEKPTVSPTKKPTGSPTKKKTDGTTKRKSSSSSSFKKKTDSPTKKPTDSPTKKKTDGTTKSPSSSSFKKKTNSTTKKKSSSSSR